MSCSTLDFCLGLCVFNNEKGLPFVFENLLRLESIVNTLQIIVYYNDSEDNSLSIIEEFEPKFKHKFIIMKYPHKPYIERTTRIATARNGVLTVIRDYFSYMDYFIMMDSNEYSCIGDIQLPVFQEIMERKDEWDSLSGLSI